ncbi:MAG: DUF924 family protein [Burkholderiaceae bacterium]
MSAFSPEAILEFWFLPPDDAGFGKKRAEWFTKSASFDQTCRALFEPAVQAGMNGELNHWAADDASAESFLALILLLDQITRNIYRDDARMVAGDTIALLTARKLVASGKDENLLPVQRAFAYLPFEHSENLAMQHESLRLFKQLDAFDETKDMFIYAEKHAVIIERFGRFPHRNDLLGRTSSPEEIEFLTQPGSRF